MTAWTALACLALLLPGVARAQARIAVLSFSGPRGGDARAALVRRLRQDYEVVDGAEWSRTARRLRAAGRRDQDFARVAEELEVSAVVSGGVQRARRMWRVSVTVRNGSDGSVLRSVSRQARSLGAAASSGAALASQVATLIQGSAGAAREGPATRRDEARVGGGEEGDEREGPATRRAAARVGGGEEGDEREGPATRRAAARVGDGGEEGEEALEDEDGREPMPPVARPVEGLDDERPPALGGRPAAAQASDREPGGGPAAGGAFGSPDVSVRAPGPRRASPWGWLDLAVELDGAERDFTVPINQALDMGSRQEARFSSSIYPEAGARLAFYPGALFTSGWASGIGVEASFHHYLYLSIENKRRNEEVAAEEYSLTVGGVYRAVLGSAERGVTIRARVGYGRFSFFLGDVGNDIVPPMVYDHVYVGLSASIPLGTRYAGIDLGAGYLAVLGIGLDAARAYNQSGSAPSSHGFTFEVGASGQIVGGLRWRIAFEMLGFVTEHQGIGMGWGAEPTTIIGSGGRGIQTMGPAVDTHFRIIPSLVYRFGWRPDPASGASSGRAWYDDGGGGGGSRGQDQEEDGDGWDSEEW